MLPCRFLRLTARTFALELPHVLEVCVWDDDGFLHKADFMGRFTLDIDNAACVKGVWRKLLPPLKYADETRFLPHLQAKDQGRL
jgi:hypothetical protein